jgi:hypothetical protein
MVLEKVDVDENLADSAKETPRDVEDGSEEVSGEAEDEEEDADGGRGADDEFMVFSA